MRIIHWNISWASSPEAILRQLKTELSQGFTIACLQEVTPSAYAVFRKELLEHYILTYSLNFRAPSKYDSKSRRLGVLIIAPDCVCPVSDGVIFRTSYPERTCYFKFSWFGQTYSILSLHSVTGVNYKKGKSVQFDSFAEAIDELLPDIVTFDANEPMVDHYDLSRMQFFDNGDKGAGARRFFQSLTDQGLEDACTHFYDKSRYIPGEPLAVSHIINGKARRRYDFIFVNTKRIPLLSCAYNYADGVAATADHAIVSTGICLDESARGRNPNLDPNCRPITEQYREEDLLKFCRYYDGKTVDPEHKQMGEYEQRWVEMMQNDKRFVQDLIIDYIRHYLETFSLDDGVPISLKALLFNRYMHWGPGTPDGFKDFYRKCYLFPGSNETGTDKEKRD